MPLIKEDGGVCAWAGRIVLGGGVVLRGGSDGMARLRYTTSHPLDMDDELIFAHRDIPALMPYLHLPVQAGSDHVLTAMNRRHSADDYKRIINRLRDVVPNLALSGDFIVGFPGETDQDFADTLRLVDEVKYASAYSFKYSERPGTPAANSGDQIDEGVKSERLASLQQLLDAQRFAFNKSCEGQTMSVLVERQGSRDGQMTGRSPFMQSVYFAADDSQIGDILTMKITEGRQNSVVADILRAAQ